MKADNRKKLLEKIKDDIVNLKESPLYNFRISNKFHPVIGEGNHFARIMFIGEAPGKNEALKGKPFCGNSGKILDELLESVSIKREDVYITNIVKDRPPLNRDPSPQEIDLYGPFLDQQINIIQPEIIIALGRFSTNYILKKFNLEKEIKSISLLHGNIFNTKSDYGKLKIITFFHPAAAIYDNKKRDLLFDKIKIIK